jgi:dipeptide transport system permease protein
MFAFILKRLAILVPTFFGVTLLAFLLVRLIPGDPVQIMAGVHVLTPERHAELLHQLGLDQPLWRQYLTYITAAFHGNLGNSFVTQLPVWQEFWQRFPATIELSICAMIFAVVIGIPAGIIAALCRGKLTDQSIMAVALTGYSMPIFWWGLLLILLFSVTLGWLPVSGRISVLYFITPKTGFLLIDTLLEHNMDAFWSAVKHLILPSIVLGTIPLAAIARMTRSAMLEVLQEDYIRTARAKGLMPMRVVCVHALRNALIPVVTSIGLQVGVLMTGAILTETIFSWPGIGSWLVKAVVNRDYPVVQGGILFVATLIILVNAIVDLLYGLLNPRIRH